MKVRLEVKAIAISALVVGLLVSTQSVYANELINTATNEIAEPKDLGKRDVLEEIYADLDSKAQQTDSTFILVEQEDETVTLFTINYPYEDYADTDLPMIELGTFELMELVN